MRLTHPTRSEPALTDGAALLELRAAHVHYGGIRALRGLDLHVNRGEIVALVGANGAGKTTALRALSRLIRLTQGSAHFAGSDMAPWSPVQAVRHGLSLVPEGRALFLNLSVRENLELGAYSHRDRRAIGESIDDIIALFPRIGERINQTAGTLSGGEQQMVAIGRGLMARPLALLLDEPSLGIAPKLVEQIFEAIERIARDGVTVLLVEQNTRLALAVSKRAYVLKTGEIALSGPSKELADREEVRAAYLGG